LQHSLNVKLAFICVMLVALSLVPSPSSAQTTITQVQCARGKMTSGTSFADVLSSGPTAGNDLVLTLSTFGGSTVPTISSITEANVAWSVQKAFHPTSGNSNDAEIWLGVVSAGASSTITISLTIAPSFGAVSNVCEYSGLASSPLDQTASNSGVSSDGDTGTTGVTSQATELWIGTIAGVNTISSPTNGFTLIDGVANNPANVANGYFQKIVSSTGQANTGTSSSIGNFWTGVIATFKASTGPTTTTTSSTSTSSTTTATSSTTTAAPNSFNVHAGATQVVVTVMWSGTGTASVQISGPGGTPILSESGAVIYDRVTYASGSSTPINIHRVTFTLSPSPITAQTWTALVTVSGSYTVTIEVT